MDKKAASLSINTIIIAIIALIILVVILVIFGVNLGNFGKQVQSCESKGNAVCASENLCKNGNIVTVSGDIVSIVSGSSSGSLLANIGKFDCSVGKVCCKVIYAGRSS